MKNLHDEHSRSGIHSMSAGKWPKTRPPMSENVKAIYEDNYVSNRAGDGLINKATIYLERWMHREVSAVQCHTDQVLEIGPGNLNHSQYLRCAAWDVVEPYDPLYLEGADHHHLVRKRYIDISEVPKGCYDRVFSIAVMEHICDLPTMLVNSFSALKPGGKFQAAIPSEGGFLWQAMSWHLKGVFFKLKYRADYHEIMSWEHVNTANEIIYETKRVFGNVSIKKFPNLGQHGSIYTYVEAKKYK